ncbi:hypothetical protein [Paraburkholderia sp. MM5477-R1]|uniref:hypothetical protein n=1 Tax=Paraburkholderia sp. MM5477-R1 TaxID=2991062 RepID=UPI003D254367
MNNLVSTTYRIGDARGAMRDIIWAGDNIGLGGGEDHVTVGLRDSSGRQQFVSLEQALAVAERIDPQSGYQRLSEALPSAAADGYLCPVDLAAWRAAEHRIAALMYDSAQDLDVSFWQVAEDRIEDGRRVSGVPLSGKFAAEEQCREAAAEIKVTKPDAYLVRHTVHFHWSKTKDISERARLLDEIRGVAA